MNHGRSERLLCLWLVHCRAICLSYFFVIWLCDRKHISFVRYGMFQEHTFDKYYTDSGLSFRENNSTVTLIKYIDWHKTYRTPEYYFYLLM